MRSDKMVEDFEDAVKGFFDHGSELEQKVSN